jgi:hypothetical protein
MKPIDFETLMYNNRWGIKASEDFKSLYKLYKSVDKFAYDRIEIKFYFIKSAVFIT